MSAHNSNYSMADESLDSLSLLGLAVISYNVLSLTNEGRLPMILSRMCWALFICMQGIRLHWGGHKVQQFDVANFMCLSAGAAQNKSTGDMIAVNTKFCEPKNVKFVALPPHSLRHELWLSVLSTDETISMSWWSMYTCH